MTTQERTDWTQALTDFWTYRLEKYRPTDGPEYVERLFGDAEYIIGEQRKLIATLLGNAE